MSGDVQERLTRLPAVITHREVRELHVAIARLDEKLDRTLDLSAEVAALRERLEAAEKDLVAAGANARSFGRVIDWVWAAGLALISAGVWLG